MAAADHDVAMATVAAIASVAAIAVAAGTIARFALPYLTMPPMIAALVLGMALSRIGGRARYT